MRIREGTFARATVMSALLLATASACGSGEPAVGSVSAELSVTVSGSVHDASGTPIADARIDFLQDGLELASVTTGPDGAWSLVLEDGTYDVAITPPPGSAFVAQTLFAQEIAADTSFQIVLVAASLVQYTAQLRDRDGAPLVGASVCLSGPLGGTCGTTDAAGDAEIAVVPGTYEMWIDATRSNPLVPEWVAIGAGERTLTGDTTETITVENRLLTGVVVDPDGAPVPNVSLVASEEATIPGQLTRFHEWASTDEAGRFSLRVLRGTVDTYVAPDPESGLATVRVSTPVDGDAQIVITVPRLLRWTAQVRDRDGTGLAGLSVCLYGPSSHCGDTDVSGDVEIAAAPGSYDLEIRLDVGMNPLLPESMRLTLPGPTLTVDATETITVENRALTGMVVDADGNPVPNATITADGVASIPGGSGEFHGWTYTDATGRFALPVLRGTVDLDVIASETGSRLSELSTVVDEDTDLVIALPRPVLWTGRLRDRDGTALAGVSVCLNGSSVGTCDWTDALGEVRLSVAPGSYGVFIETTDSPNPQLPQTAVLSLPGPTLTADTIETITIDNRSVAGVAVDADGNPVANASISAGGQTTYPDGWAWTYDATQTDAAGHFTLRALQGTMEMHVTPDPASGLSAFALQNIVVDGDTSLAVALQFATDAIEAPVAAGESVTTDHEGDGATPADPVETVLTSPADGMVAIQEAPITESAPTGYSFLTQQVNVVAPASTADAPLVLTFVIDGSRIPVGQDESTLQIFRNGAVVPACTGPEGVASPDPCVASRTRVGDDVVITALSSRASEWNLGVRRIGDADLDGLLDDVDACPAEPEDADGFNDEDGCPDLDDDADGVEDAIDLCPREPEDLDGFEDDDGCAEAGPDTGPTCADLAGDGRVTVRDMVAVARSLGSSIGDCRYREEADLDLDGDVDVADLRIVREQRGTVCTSSP